MRDTPTVLCCTIIREPSHTPCLSFTHPSIPRASRLRAASIRTMHTHTYACCFRLPLSVAVAGAQRPKTFGHAGMHLHCLLAQRRSSGPLPDPTLGKRRGTSASDLPVLPFEFCASVLLCPTARLFQMTAFQCWRRSFIPTRVAT